MPTIEKGHNERLWERGRERESIRSESSKITDAKMYTLPKSCSGYGHHPSNSKGRGSNSMAGRPRESHVPSILEWGEQAFGSRGRGQKGENRHTGKHAGKREICTSRLVQAKGYSEKFPGLCAARLHNAPSLDADRQHPVQALSRLETTTNLFSRS